MSLPAYAMNQASFPEMYERWLVEPLFRPWVDALLEHASLAPGRRVLDLACGTGIVARVAKERLGDDGFVVGVDLSPQMLDVARRIAPGVEWREGNAVALPFGEQERFDVVLCQQGLQFFPDGAAAVTEMRRVLAPGGRLAVSTWRPLEETPFFLALHHVAERRLGTIADRRFALGDAKRLEALLTAAGFEDVRVETMTRIVRFPEPMIFVRMNAMALVGMASSSKTLGEEERLRLVGDITDESAAVLGPWTDGDGVAFEIGTNVATARP